jgi:hypothetical protein
MSLDEVRRRVEQPSVADDASGHLLSDANRSKLLGQKPEVTEVLASAGIGTDLTIVPGQSAAARALEAMKGDGPLNLGLNVIMASHYDGFPNILQSVATAKNPSDLTAAAVYLADSESLAGALARRVDLTLAQITDTTRKIG